MKKIIWILTVAFLVACNSGNPVEQKKQKLVNYKEQVVQLNLKIKQLEHELGSDSSLSATSLIPVKGKEITPVVFDHFIEVSGRVQPDQEAYISSEISGHIVRIYVNEGDRVKKGTLLFKLNTSLTESSISEAKTQLALAKLLYMKQKELWNQKIGSEVQFLQSRTNYEAARERLKTLQAQLDLALIRAPFNGIVDQIMIKEGELATPGRQLAILINLTKMKIYADVSEQYLNKIHPGDPAFVVFPDLEKKTTMLNIYRTGNLINEKSRNFRIEIKLNNPSEQIKPNQFVLIRLNDFHTDSALVVPSAIIKQDLKGYFLYRLKEQGNSNIVVKTYVQPGVFYNNQTLIEEGLESGNHVVTEGYNQVSNGQEVTVIKEK
ncbi:MAG: efflux RND transporter periplasmic adaptor subunit [Chlorobi bacterium]|nr:efflux RND transporter periplasmic adaptor subunit [Chlorobiota bacterium]